MVHLQRDVYNMYCCLFLYILCMWILCIHEGISSSVIMCTAMCIHYVNQYVCTSFALIRVYNLKCTHLYTVRLKFICAILRYLQKKNLNFYFDIMTTTEDTFWWLFFFLKSTIFFFLFHIPLIFF